jgi:hypothetical protein
MVEAGSPVKRGEAVVADHTGENDQACWPVAGVAAARRLLFMVLEGMRWLRHIASAALDDWGKRIARRLGGPRRSAC